MKKMIKKIYIKDILQNHNIAVKYISIIIRPNIHMDLVNINFVLFIV